MTRVEIALGLRLNVQEFGEGEPVIFIHGGSMTHEVWDHQMAVSPAPGDASKTLWRDRLVIGGGAAPALWPVLWATWQWRGARLRALAPTWAHDPETENAQGDAAAEA